MLQLLLYGGMLGLVVACSSVETAEGRKAFERELKKAELGDRLAASRVGGMYLGGVGTPRDAAKAVYWYEIGGPRGGWAMLGLMYERGTDVPKDLERAADYYQRATETGEPLAMYSLGALHAKRQISSANPVEAYMWLHLAEIMGRARGTCAIGYPCKEWAIQDKPGYRRELMERLTAAERAEAVRRADAWLAARPSIRR